MVAENKTKQTTTTTTTTTKNQSPRAACSKLVQAKEKKSVSDYIKLFPMGFFFPDFILTMENYLSKKRAIGI